MVINMEKAIYNIGIVVADTEEYRPFAEKAKQYAPKEYSCLGKEGITFNIVNNDSHTVSVTAVLCGTGKVNAASAAAVLAYQGCDIILNYGLSGGISGVKRGETVLADKFLEHDFDLTPLGYKPCEKPGQRYIYNADERLLNAFSKAIPNIKSGTAVCGDRFICSNEDRLFFKDNFDAMSCDMETAAIASVCDMAGIPFASLRRISDDAGDDAKEAYREMNTNGNAALSDLFFDGLSIVAESFGGAF